MIPTYLIIDPKWQDILDRDQEIDRLRKARDGERDLLGLMWDEKKRWDTETDWLCGAEKGGEG
jgi:hypothetical protein